MSLLGRNMLEQRETVLKQMVDDIVAPEEQMLPTSADQRRGMNIRNIQIPKDENPKLHGKAAKDIEPCSLPCTELVQVGQFVLSKEIDKA